MEIPAPPVPTSSHHHFPPNFRMELHMLSGLTVARSCGLTRRHPTPPRCSPHLTLLGHRPPALALSSLSSVWQLQVLSTQPGRQGQPTYQAQDTRHKGTRQEIDPSVSLHPLHSLHSLRRQFSLFNPHHPSSTTEFICSQGSSPEQDKQQVESREHLSIHTHPNKQTWQPWAQRRRNIR